MPRTPVSTPRTDDPRYQRVRLALNDAIRELAATRPADRIAVADVAVRAGVSRTTFYAHAPTPVRLLAAALLTDLTPVLERVMREVTDPRTALPDVWRTAYLGLLEHVAANDAVYRTALDGGSALFPILIDGLEPSARRMVDAAAERMDEDVTGLWRDMAVLQLTHGSIVTVTTWLRTQPPADPAQVVETYLTLAPPWQLARPDASGRLVLRRSQRRKPPGREVS